MDGPIGCSGCGWGKRSFWDQQANQKRKFFLGRYRIWNRDEYGETGGVICTDVVLKAHMVYAIRIKGMHAKDNLCVMCTLEYYIPMIAQYAIQTEYAMTLNATVNDSFNQSQPLTGGAKKKKKRCIYPYAGNGYRTVCRSHE